MKYKIFIYILWLSCHSTNVISHPTHKDVFGILLSFEVTAVANSLSSNLNGNVKFLHMALIKFPLHRTAQIAFVYAYYSQSTFNNSLLWHFITICVQDKF